MRASEAPIPGSQPVNEPPAPAKVDASFLAALVQRRLPQTATEGHFLPAFKRGSAHIGIAHHIQACKERQEGKTKAVFDMV